MKKFYYPQNEFTYECFSEFLLFFFKGFFLQKKALFFILFLFQVYFLYSQTTISLDQMDLSAAISGKSGVKKNKNYAWKALTINGIVYPKGLGTVTNSDITILLGGAATRFQATVGVDDGVSVIALQTAEFKVLADGQEIWSSGVMNYYDVVRTKVIDINITGKSRISLITTNNVPGTYTDWIAAKIIYNGTTVPICVSKDKAGTYKLPMYPFRNDMSKYLVIKTAFDVLHNETVKSVDSVLNFYKKLDFITRGIPKMSILVGWQEGGHDFQYPKWGPVNHRLKRDQDPSAIESIRYLMNEAPKYNVNCSFHCNLVDAYQDSPVWSEWSKLDLFCKYSDGSFISNWYDSRLNRTGYAVNLMKAWQAGKLQENYDTIISYFPKILETGFILTDANLNFKDSPYNGYTSADAQIAYKNIITWQREKYNIDNIGEYAIDLLPMMYGMLQYGTTYGRGESGTSPMYLPSYLSCGGSDNWGSNDITKLFGISIQLEDDRYFQDINNVIPDFACKTLQYFFLNTKLRLGYDKVNAVAEFSDSVKSFINKTDSRYPQGALVVTQYGNPLRIGDDVFFPELWRTNREIMSFSANGSTRTWTLPRDWKDVTAVDIYNVNKNGITKITSTPRNVSSHKITLTLSSKQLVFIVPTGTDINANPPKQSVGTAFFKGSDESTKGDWNQKYGTLGYDITGTTAQIPSYLKLSYSGTKDTVFNGITADVRALKNPDDLNRRIASAKISYLHDIVDVEIPKDSMRSVSLYFMDWANEFSQTMVEVLDANTRNVIDCRYINSYQQGIYLSYNVTGHVLFRLTRLFYENMGIVGRPVFSGVFIDKVIKEQQSISFTLSPQVEFSDDYIELNAVASSGLPVTYTVSDNSIAQVTNGKLYFFKQGTVSVTASQSGNNNYDAAIDVSQQISIVVSGINPTFENGFIKLYPSEDGRTLYVSSLNQLKFKGIYNSAGQRFSAKVLSDNLIDLSELVSGVYFVQFVNSKKETISIKFNYNR